MDKEMLISTKKNEYIALTDIKLFKTQFGHYQKYGYGKCMLCGQTFEARYYSDDRNSVCSDYHLLLMLKRDYKQHFNQKHKLQQDINKADTMKPWDDPESLYCDTDFLNTELNLKIRNSGECRG